MVNGGGQGQGLLGSQVWKVGVGGYGADGQDVQDRFRFGFRTDSFRVIQNSSLQAASDTCRLR